MNSDNKKPERPVFAPQIPSYLSDKLTPAEKYTVETISVIEQSVRWTIDNVLKNSEELYEMESRLQAMEKWKNIITGKWAAIVAICGFIITGVVDFIVSHLFK